MKMDNKLYLFCLVCLGILIGIHTLSFGADVRIKAIPNESTPRTIILENDSLSMKISLDWKLSVKSLKFKKKNIELIQSDTPMPLIGIENQWTLFNVGFGIRNVSIQRTKEFSTVLIHAYSNYLENPFHIFVQLSIGENPEIKAKIWLVNRFKKGFSDIYRGGKTTVVPGIPWLAFLSPDPGGVRKVLYPTEESYLLTSVSEKLMENYHPVHEWERPPEPGPVKLYFLWGNPILPTTVEFPKLNIGVFLYREKSDIPWHFDSIGKALWPSHTMRVAEGDTIHIFEGVLSIFEGDWHKSYNWFKNRIRSNFDFTYYKRPGYMKFRKDFLAYFSFIYNHMIYDPYKNRFMPKRFLQKAKREFGGIDQYWFWHSYPRAGVDPRDQFDLYEDLPGGMKGLKEFISTCHSMGTHVFLAYNPWDKIRKRKDMYKKQAEILGAVGADGLHLDTMSKADLPLRTEIDKYNPEAQFVTEGRPSIEGLQFTTESFDHPIHCRPMPVVDLLRFIIPEHQVFKIVRWDRNRRPLIYNALFNATGYAVWEDVFGEMNLPPWDEKILITRYNRIMHDFVRAVTSNNVMPLIPTLRKDLFVNGFFTDELYFYTLYQTQRDSISHFFDNRMIGPLFYINLPDDWHIVDVWNKRPVEIRKIKGRKCVFLPQEMPEEVGCFVATPKRIQVSQKNGKWIAQIPGGASGTLELVGIDITKRNIIGPEVNADSLLVFDMNSVKKSTDGYVMIQYRNDNKEVKDVALVKVGY